MDQKRILWVVAAVGLFLVIVIGAALLLYAPPKPTETRIASSPVSDTWIVPQRQEQVKDLTVVAETTNVYSDTVTSIDLNALGNVAASNAATNNFTTVNGTTIGGSVEAPPVQEVAKPEAPIVSKPRATPRPAPKAVAKLTPPAPVAITEFWIQAGSFTDKIYADQVRDELAKLNYNSEVFTKTIDGMLRYRVRVGPYSNKVEAEDALLTIRNDTLFASSYLTSVKVPK